MLKNNIDSTEITIEKATTDLYPVIQNLARFYAYDISRHCGFISYNWSFPENGLYDCFFCKDFFMENNKNDREAYIIRVKGELSGFALIDKIGLDLDTDWNMDEFFIIAKFQGKGVASEVARRIFSSHLGTWEVAVIPDNTPALKFWEKIISSYKDGLYKRDVRQVDYDIHQPKRVIFKLK
jgi:predicted acetyltransferase